MRNERERERREGKVERGETKKDEREKRESPFPQHRGDFPSSNRAMERPMDGGLQWRLAVASVTTPCGRWWSVRK